MSKNGGTAKPAETEEVPGFAVAAAIGLWAALAVLAVPYLDLDGPLRVCAYVLALVMGIIGIAGFAMELSDVTRQPGVGYVGIGLGVFGLPTLIAYILDNGHDYGSPWRGLLRAAVLVMAAFAVMFVVVGVGAIIAAPRAERARVDPRRLARGVYSLVSALTALASAVVALFNVFE